MTPLDKDINVACSSPREDSNMTESSVLKKIEVGQRSAQARPSLPSRYYLRCKGVREEVEDAC